MDSSLVVLVVASAILIGVVMFVARQTKPRLNKQYFAQHWQRIEREANPVAAITAADSLLDEAMKRHNVKGTTMGERLNNSRAFVKNINPAWSAHKLRNRLVHEPGTQVSQAELKRALSNFRRALKDLGAL